MLISLLHIPKQRRRKSRGCGCQVGTEERPLWSWNSSWGIEGDFGDRRLVCSALWFLFSILFTLFSVTLYLTSLQECFIYPLFNHERLLLREGNNISEIEKEESNRSRFFTFFKKYFKHFKSILNIYSWLPDSPEAGIIKKNFWIIIINKILHCK